MKFRPHHFLCALGFEGKGYSSVFIDNFTQLVARLKEAGGDNTVIEVEFANDDICVPCPNRQGDKCASQEKIDRLDKAHARALDLNPPHNLTWGEAKQRIREKMTLEKFHSICTPCEWKKMGICEAHLRNHLNS